MHVKWTKERLEALKELAKKSMRYKPSGIPYSRMYWEDGMAKIDGSTRKKLGDIDISTIKSAWMRYQNVIYGYCINYKKCGNKVSGEGTRCKACHKEFIAKRSVMYPNYAFKVSTIIANKKEAIDALSTIPDKELRKIIVNNITEVKSGLRRRLLGERYKKAVLDKVKLAVE